MSLFLLLPLLLDSSHQVIVHNEANGGCQTHCVINDWPNNPLYDLEGSELDLLEQNIFNEYNDSDIRTPKG